MAIFNQAIVDGAHVVARAAEFQIRRAVTSAISSGVPPTPVPTSMSPTSNPTDPTATATQGPSDNPTKKSDGGTGSSSPLLFFVALGFGVVFTNLWIIVGVKYCFRYNARNRALARVDENGEPIDMQNMPVRPHRRRREKKLMTMDEVNEKFPMVKYKTWVLERKRDGLPTAGGISASRANSIRSVEGVVPEQASGIRQSTDEPVTNANPIADPIAQKQVKPTDKDEQKPSSETPNTTATATADKTAPTTNDASEVPAVQTVEDSSSKHRSSEDDDEEDDDHIDAAMDPDMVGSSGDTCAICIDTLEDDDDVRGLTCGHAFHAVCLDPWLTNRRACCPLCKADYYTPKVRPQPAEGEAQDPNAPVPAGDPSRNNGRMNYPRAPVRSFGWSHFRDAPRQMFPSRFDNPRDPAELDRRYRSQQRPAQPSRRNTANETQPGVAREENEGNVVTRFRNRFPPFRLDQVMRRNREAQAAGTQQRGQTGSSSNDAVPAATTPSQLEAGVRPSTAQAN
ncbi:hypothetical protein HD806DRAFT_48672 [Xylariaceae sp. AK1471]|nr:hypothetical protein HD806DRAFT_48672 [Xylariaceae sp. AK1471]